MLEANYNNLQRGFNSQACNLLCQPQIHSYSSTTRPDHRLEYRTCSYCPKEERKSLWADRWMKLIHQTRPGLESLPRVTLPSGSLKQSFSVLRRPIRTMVWCSSILHVIDHVILRHSNSQRFKFKQLNQFLFNERGCNGVWATFGFPSAAV